MIWFKYLVRRWPFFCLILFFIPSQLRAQNQVVRGVVLDKDSKQSLIGARVVLLDTNPLLGSMSDTSGYFRISDVPTGRYTIQVTYTGYEPLVLPEVLVGAGKEVQLVLELTEKIGQLSEVVISGGQAKGDPVNEMAGTSARSFTVDEASRFSGSFNGDIARIAQSYAGVTGSGITNELVIRGNSSKGLLWRLEGIEVPNLNHLASNGSSGGGLSILSVNVIRNSDFYTSAFPAEYGNALSGVFDVKLRTGNEEKPEYAIQAGFMGLEAALEGPFSKKNKSSYLINYRYATTGIFELIGLDVGGSTLPLFHDLTFKFNLPTKNAGLFTFFGIGGYSRVSVPAVKDSTVWESSSDRYEDISISNMAATGFMHKLFLNEKTYLQSYIAFTASQLGARVDSLDNVYQLQSVLRSAFVETAMRASSMVNCKINAKNTLRAGFILSLLGFDLHSSDEVNDIVFLSSKGNAFMSQGYAQLKHRFNDFITLNSGLHYTWFELTNQHLIDPRMSFHWNINSRHSLSLGGGLHNRLEPLTFYFTQIQQPDGSYTKPNQNLKPTRAAHGVLGYDAGVTEYLRLRVELYYQHLFNVPVENDSSSGFSVLNYNVSFLSSIDNDAGVAFVNEGSGRNYGVEFTLERFLHKNYYYLLTASLYESKYTALDGKERNTRFNNNFICNVIAGKEFPVGKNKKNAWLTDVKLVWSGGVPLTPIDVNASSLSGTTIYELDQRYTLKAPDYFRLDFKVGYRKNGNASSHYFFLDIQNLTNQQNVFGQYFDAEENEIVTIYQLGLIPIFNYRVQF